MTLGRAEKTAFYVGLKGAARFVRKRRQRLYALGCRALKGGPAVMWHILWAARFARGMRQRLYALGCGALKGGLAVMYHSYGQRAPRLGRARLFSLYAVPSELPFDVSSARCFGKIRFKIIAISAAGRMPETIKTRAVSGRY